MDVTVDCGNLLQLIRQACNESLNAAGEQILQDCNYFCLQDQSTLMASAITAFSGGTIGTGSLEISWNTPYAKRRYYEPCRVCTDINPNARIRWAEEAARTYAQGWADIIAKGAASAIP